jgi:hypothetical protein
MADIKDLIGAIVNKDALAVKEIFSSIVGAKIGERMETLRPLVAADMFNEGKMKCEECGYGMAKEDSNCKKCGCSMNEDYDWDSFVDENIEDLDEGDDPLRNRTGINAVNKKPRSGQTDLGNIPVGNLPKSNRSYDDEDRKGQPGRLKSAIKRSLGTHNKVSLPEADDNVKDDAPDTVAKDHPLVQLKKILDTKGGAFRTSTGKTVNVDHASAKRLLALHNATQKTEVKQKFAAAIHRDPIGIHDKFFPKAKIGEETELDELRRSTLGSYATKALKRGDIASRMSKSDDDAMGKIANKRFAGVKLAARKIATSAGAGRATATAVGKNVDMARTAGMGASSGSNKDREDSGKSYNAAQRGINKLRDMGEESELDELSQDTLVSYGQKARKAGGRTKGTAMAVKKILAARGKSTGVKVPASEETE